MEQKRTTISDVAERAGVSASTVSHVINETRHVNPETKYKVLNAMQELDYYSSIQAKALATGRTNTIGLIVSDISNPFFPQIIQGIEQLASKDGYDILLFNTSYEVEAINNAARKLIEFHADGALVMTTEINPKSITLLNSKQIPLVLLDWGINKEQTIDIKENFYSGIFEAIDYLIELEHKNITLITGPMEFRSAKTRKDAFIDAVSRYENLPLEISIIESDFSIEGGRQVLNQILEQEHRSTAVLASNDLMAIGLMQQAKLNKLAIPEDLSIIGIDDIPFASLMDPPLTTICVPRDKIYENAWNSLSALLHGTSNGNHNISIDTWLIKRSSVSNPTDKIRR